MQKVAISKAKVERTGGMVVLPVKEYDRLVAAAVPTYYLSGKAATDLDKLVAQGLQAHREGKTRKLRSLADLD